MDTSASPAHFYCKVAFLKTYLCASSVYNEGRQTAMDQYLESVGSFEKLRFKIHDTLHSL